ncbi:uncharacterized protein PGRI_026600 [Penicillium griseofulvum]|uniref:Uncharacterized protein n=1 Tax=Penicillium patulum TaxID=5078 RepID=A0A135LIP8_PENPA|nr:uncharacterized protein PGRI_026600 [Penicillium griseofulvum]KXG48790.1 hypothetical protein PGRI_026600 [Penicillium griseofulvum]
MDDTMNTIPQTWCFILRYERLELMLACMKEITTPFISQSCLNLLRIDLNHLDMTSGKTSSSVTRYFMPRTDTPRIEKIRPDPSWDWFLSQKGNYGRGAHSANYLLQRVFMDYQDWSIPEFWPQLDGKSGGKENYKDSTVQESGRLDSAKDDKVCDKPDDRAVCESGEINSDKVKEGEIRDHGKYDDNCEDCNKSEESCGEDCKPSDGGHDESQETDKDADDHEMVILNSLDLDIRNYQTDDWLVYWYQRLYDIDLPDKKHGISIARTMERDHPHKCHAWALADVSLCGHDRPSTAELIALVSWGLRGMSRQIELLANGIEPEDVHMLSEVFPVRLIHSHHPVVQNELY